MKFALAKEHKDFYQKNGWIEFENVVSNEHLSLVNDLIEEVLAERLNIPLPRVFAASPSSFFIEGHDVWRSNFKLRKFITQTNFSDIASELMEKKSLRIGYDQIICAPSPRNKLFPQPADKDMFIKFIEGITTLDEVSSFKGVLGGLMICLKGEQKDLLEHTSQGVNVFPKKSGRVIFFKPSVSVEWNQLLDHEGQLFYLIVYTQEMAYYTVKPQDPHAHYLKRFGYMMHDKLTDKLNPLCR